MVHASYLAPTPVSEVLSYTPEARRPFGWCFAVCLFFCSLSAGDVDCVDHDTIRYYGSTPLVGQVIPAQPLTCLGTLRLLVKFVLKSTAPSCSSNILT